MHENNGIENNRGRARRLKKIAIQSLTLRLGSRWHLAGARAQAKLLGDYTRTLPLNRLCLVEPFRLGLSLSLGTSRHPRPFDKRFIIKESSSPALIHASLDGVCLTDMGWAVKRLQSLLPLRHPVTSVNTTSTVTRFISSGACCFDRDSTKIHYTLSICLAFAQSL